MEQSSYLILGGCGFIGRNLVTYLIDNNLAKFVRVVDKVPPQVAWLNTYHQTIFQHGRVEFKSANLINAESCRHAFQAPDGIQWDFVVNCAGETKTSQNEQIYEEGILKLSVNCAKEARRCNAKRYIEISSGCMQSWEKPHKENDELDPWNSIGKWKKEAEVEIKNIDALNFTILRCGLVYGRGDKQGLTTRLLITALYRQLNESLKVLWNGDIVLNTIHVDDVSKAIVFACGNPAANREVFNVVDDAGSTLGSLSQLLSDLYGVKIAFLGVLLSKVVDLKGACDDANDKHLAIWGEVCSFDKLANTPLSPLIDVEFLFHKHLNLNGDKLKSLGWSCSIPQPLIELIKEMIDYYMEMGVFPKSLAP